VFHRKVKAKVEVEKKNEVALHCARRARPFLGRAFREQEDDQAASPLLPQPPTKGSGQGCPLLRASSDHRFIVGALRARRPPGHSSPSPPSLFTLPLWEWHS